MSIRVYRTAEFADELRGLKKKYPQVVEDVKALLKDFQIRGIHGAQIPNVDKPVYKVRLRNTSARRGKSGGFRVVYLVLNPAEVVFLFIYSKTAKNDVSAAEIRGRLADYQRTRPE